MTNIITVANQKGGVGKSTTVLNLGLGLVERGKKVLLIDMDVQSNLTSAFGEEVVAHSEEKNLHVGRLLVGEKSFDEVLYKLRETLHLIPSTEKLRQYEEAIFSRMNREMVLKKALKGNLESYDYVLFDTPPNNGVMTNSALFASNSYLVPVEPESFSYDGISKLIRHVNEIGEDNGITLGGVILTQYHPNQRGSLIQAIAKAVKEDSLLRPFHTSIRKNAPIHEAQHLKQSLFEYAPTSNAVEDYLNLTDEVIMRYETV